MRNSRIRQFATLLSRCGASGASRLNEKWTGRWLYKTPSHKFSVARRVLIRFSLRKVAVAATLDFANSVFKVGGDLNSPFS